MEETKAPWSGPDTAAFCPVNWSSTVFQIYHPFPPRTQFTANMKATLLLRDLNSYKTPTTNCTQYKEKVIQVWINQTGSGPKRRLRLLCVIPRLYCSRSAAFLHVEHLFYCLLIDLTLPLLITALCPFFSFRTSLQYIAWDRIKSTLGDSKASLKILISIPWKKRILDIEMGRKVYACTPFLNAPFLFPFKNIFISC